MRILLSILTCYLLLCSCAEHYNISGNSSMDGLDGRMVYLRFTPDGEIHHELDSCEVIHGRFSFMGDVDSVIMAYLSVGEMSMLPVVIEESANLTMELDNVIQSVSGSPLNERLYAFYLKKEGIESQMWEVEHHCLKQLRQGMKQEEINKHYRREMKRLSKQLEEMETKFIMENYDNVLGPGFFMMLCRQFPSPVITEQIEEIFRCAPPSFMQDPFVRKYLHRAKSKPNRHSAPNQ